MTVLIICITSIIIVSIVCYTVHKGVHVYTTQDTVHRSFSDYATPEPYEGPSVAVDEPEPPTTNTKQLNDMAALINEALFATDKEGD